MSLIFSICFSFDYIFHIVVGSIVRCDQCSVYIQIEPNESTPLLYPNKASKSVEDKKHHSLCGVVKIIGFSMLIFGGCGIASYLLMNDSKFLVFIFK